jgi:hypothetical protein
MAIVLRTNTLVEDYQYISKSDDAVDADAADFDEKWRLYQEGKGDPPLKAGKEPTVFTMQHLRSVRDKKLLHSESGKHGAGGALITACLLSLKSADNLRDESGKLVKLEQELNDGVWCCAQESVDLLGLDLVLELGGVALSRMNASPK